jgi:EamA domain-containing membrane protein RarD
MAVGPVLLAALAVLAVGYCIYVWVRKAKRPASWTGFLATTMCALVLVLLPSIVAIYIPLVDFLNRSTTSLPK